MSQKPKNFSQAIDELEKTQADPGSGGESGSRLEREIHRIEEILEQVKPHLSDLGDKVGTEAHKARRRVEKEVTNNPLAAIGLVGLLAFVLGYLFGSRRRN